MTDIKRKIIYLIIYLFDCLLTLLILSFATPISVKIIDRINKMFLLITTDIFVNKIMGHFLLFFINGILYYLFINETNKNKLLYILLPGFVLGLLSEFIQLFLANRNPCFADVTIDYIAYLFGFLLFDYFSFLKGLKHSPIYILSFEGLEL